MTNPLLTTTLYMWLCRTKWARLAAAHVRAAIQATRESTVATHARSAVPARAAAGSASHARSSSSDGLGGLAELERLHNAVSGNVNQRAIVDALVAASTAPDGWVAPMLDNPFDRPGRMAPMSLVERALANLGSQQAEGEGGYYQPDLLLKEVTQVARGLNAMDFPHTTATVSQLLRLASAAVMREHGPAEMHKAIPILQSCCGAVQVCTPAFRATEDAAEWTLALSFAARHEPELAAQLLQGPKQAEGKDASRGAERAAGQNEAGVGGVHKQQPPPVLPEAWSGILLDLAEYDAHAAANAAVSKMLAAVDAAAATGGGHFDFQPVLDALLVHCVDQGAGSPAAAVARAAAAHPALSGPSSEANKRRLWSLALAACRSDADFGSALALYEDASVAHKQQAASSKSGSAPVGASSYTPLLAGLLKQAGATGNMASSSGSAAQYIEKDPLDANVPHTGRYFAAPMQDGGAPLLPSSPAKARLVDELLAALAADDGLYADSSRLVQFDALRHRLGLNPSLSSLAAEDPALLCRLLLQGGGSTASVIGPIAAEKAVPLIWEATRAGMNVEPYDSLTKSVVLSGRPADGHAASPRNAADPLSARRESVSANKRWKRTGLDDVLIECSAVGTQEAMDTVRDIYTRACQQAGANSRVLLESPEAIGAAIAALWKGEAQLGDLDVENACLAANLLEPMLLPDARLPNGYQAAALGTASAMAANAGDWETVRLINLKLATALEVETAKDVAAKMKASDDAAKAKAAISIDGDGDGDDDFEDFFEKLDIGDGGDLEIKGRGSSADSDGDSAGGASSLYISNAIESFVQLCEKRAEHESVGKLLDFHERMTLLGLFTAADDHVAVLKALVELGGSQPAVESLRKTYHLIPHTLRAEVGAGVLSAMVDGNGTFSDALWVLNELCSRRGTHRNIPADVFHFNLALKSIRERDDLPDGLGLLDAMEDAGIEANTETYRTLIKKEWRFNKPTFAVKLYERMLSNDVPIDMEVTACVLHMTMNHNYTVSRLANILEQMNRELTRQNVKRDARFYVQALANCAHCVRRAYLKSERIDGYCGKQAVVAKCAGTHEFAASMYGEMLDSGLCKGHVDAKLKRQLKSMINSMLYISERLGSAKVCLELKHDLEAFGIPITHNMYVHMIGALGHSGDLDGMGQILEELQLDENVDVSLVHITAAIRQYGIAKDQQKVDQMYDLMLELNLTPDEKLNEVLIHVCKVDPLSVVWNAQRN